MMFDKCTGDMESHLTFHKIEVVMEYNALTETDREINSFFKYKNKYIFAPYSEFIVKSVTKELDVTIIKL